MTSGALEYLVAFGGGVVSFLSPCVLPLVPAYLSMVTGLEIAEIAAPMRRQLGHIARDTALFVAGFGLVFVGLGLSASMVGRALSSWHAVATRASGAVVVAMSLFLAGSLVLRRPWLYGERRFHPAPSKWGVLAAPVAGAAFGFGWTPCIGPVLASILAVASTEAQAVRAVALLVAYSLGLGVPFLAFGLAAGRLSRITGWTRRHFAGLTLAAASVMCLLGLLLVFDRLSWLTSELEAALQAVGLGRLVTLG